MRTTYYLVKTLTNIDDKANNITKKRLIASNQLFNSLSLYDN